MEAAPPGAETRLVAKPKVAPLRRKPVDILQKCEDYTLHREIRNLDLYPYYRGISSPQEPVVTMNGQKVIMLGSNNYLGLTNHDEVKEAAVAALRKYGTGCAGSRLLNGTLDIHIELEERLKSFMRAESVLTFSTGFQVNLGVLSCLLGRHDVALLDAMDHASIIDGVRLGFGKSLKYKHNDMQDLEAKLSRVAENRGKLIVVDGVFSMEGDLANLPEIVRLKNEYDSRLFVDDAHGVGVFGESGRGTAEHFGVEDEVDLVMGTFSKSLATVGGFIAASSPVIDYIRHHARSGIFSAAMPPAAAASAIKAIDIIEAEPQRRKQLWETTQYMKRELEGLGFDTGTSESPVIPIAVGDDIATFTLCKRLQEEGVFVNPIVTPAVPPGQAMIRTSYMATHNREHLDQALTALKKVGRQLDVI
ncbi:MAG: aminotransferase class I/II-fold pyridoxal phosphate-dependent enzyme [Deltaproteobacteria bacterium]|nr:aminotransferase class I/II-fold pyridoxal phosphate-dependent enzyme [Deltaproteobacteria bacterium]